MHIPEGAFDISTVVIDDMKGYLGKDRYTVTLIVDDQEVELPAGDEGEVVEDVEDEFATEKTADEVETVTDAESTPEVEGTIVASEDNLSEDAALETQERTE